MFAVSGRPERAWGLAGWPVAKYAAQPEVSMHTSDTKERRNAAGSPDAAGAKRPADDRRSAGQSGEGASSARAAKRPVGRTASVGGQPWYAGQHKDALLYLMIAIFFVEMAVGGVAFFYGVMHAAPEVPGGPPMARFPWLGWALAAILAPVGLILIVHLAGTWVSRFLGREAGDMAATTGGDGNAADADQVPERLQRFYAIIRNAPTVALLLGILLLGAALFFVDGAFTALVALGSSLTPYIPWIAGSVAAMIAVCYLVHRLFIYRHHRMQQEFAYRREVLERTGIVLVDKNFIPLPQTEEQRLALGEARIVDAQAALPAANGDAPSPETGEYGEHEAGRRNTSGNAEPFSAGSAEDAITDAEIITPEASAGADAATSAASSANAGESSAGNRTAGKA